MLSPQPSCRSCPSALSSQPHDSGSGLMLCCSPLPLPASPWVLLPPCSPFSDPVHWSPPVQWSPHNTTPAWWEYTRGCPCIVSGRYPQWSRGKKRQYPWTDTEGQQVTQSASSRSSHFGVEGAAGQIPLHIRFLIFLHLIRPRPKAIDTFFSVSRMYSGEEAFQNF